MTPAQLRSKWKNSRKEARLRGIEFSLTKDEFNSLFEDMTCKISGRKLHYNHQSRDLCSSVDRIDNSLGYVPGNVRLVSARLNTIKGDASIHEIEMILAYMKREKNV